MNVKNLGIPIYRDKNGQEYVELVDLKLALDHDKYEKVIRQLGTPDRVELDKLSRIY